MYDFIRGVCADIDCSHVVLDANGVGYKINTSLSAISKMALNSTYLLYVSFVVRENIQELYGFESKNEKKLFELLCSVSGVGPKTALMLFNKISVQELQQAIVNKDCITLSKVPGIGKKTSERIIIDLQGRVDGFYGKQQESVADNKAMDVFNALVNLGYTKLMAQKTVNKVIKEAPEDCELSELIMIALKLK